MQFEVSQKSENKFEKPVYLNFEYGIHRVRLLPPEKVIFVHYILGKATIECIGNGCPICANNKSIQLEHPDTFRSMPGYNPSNRRHYINVLDRTNVKVCRECGYENKKDLSGQYSPTCVKCGKFITGVDEKVSNKVKVANISETNAGKLNVYDSSTLDENKNPIGVENFDILFMVNRTGGKKDISPLPDTNARDVINPEDFKDQMVDLNSVVIYLSPDETLRLLGGVALRDIFAARKQTEAASLVDKEALDALDENLANLFNK